MLKKITWKCLPCWELHLYSYSKSEGKFREKFFSQTAHQESDYSVGRKGEAVREGMQWNFCCLVKPEYLLKTKEILQSTLFTKECGTLHFFFFFYQLSFFNMMNTYSSMLKKIQLSLLASLHSSHSIFTQSSASFQNDAYGIYTHIWGLILGPSEAGGTSVWPIELYKICDYVYIKCFTINMTYTILNSNISRIYFTSKSSLCSALKSLCT